MSKLIINATIQIPFDEFIFTAVRSQGPGGQNVNKVNSKVLLQWRFEASTSLPDAGAGSTSRTSAQLHLKGRVLDHYQSTEPPSSNQSRRLFAKVASHDS